MRVAIIGATGNCGVALLEALAHEPAVDEVVGIARRLPEREFAKARFVEADIACDDLVPHITGADAVVHLAWLIQPQHDPELLDEVNVEGSRRVLVATAQAGVPTLVVASSIGAYSHGPEGGTARVDEAWPTGGVETNQYSRQKAELERMLDLFGAEHPDVRQVRLRPALVFQRAAASGIRRLFAGPLVPTSLVSPDRLPALPDIPGLVTQCVHSRDLADAYRRAIVDERARGAYNVAAEPPITAESVAASIGARTVPVPEKVARAAAAAAWTAHLQPTHASWLDMGMRSPLLDTTRIRSELGWEPTVDSHSAVAELLQGIHDGAGERTPPLDPATSGPGRIQELRTGIGRRL